MSIFARVVVVSKSDSASPAADYINNLILSNDMSGGFTLADSMYAAVLTARKELKVSKSKEGLLAVVLAAKGDEAVVHSGASL